jgi:creatinine amidohydrolase
VPAIELDKVPWPEVQREIEGGRHTVVLAFGATEQHGPHMPIGTDALLGDALARALADRLEAFVAPTVRVGCSAHHVGFSGTMSVSEETFHDLVADVVRSLAAGGFRRVVLVPTHGGNFAPLAAALEKLGSVEGVRVDAITDLSVLFQIAMIGQDEHGVPLNEGGLHAGEWETSMVLALRPQAVRMDGAVPGYTGDPAAAVEVGGDADVIDADLLGDVVDVIDELLDSGARRRRELRVHLGQLLLVFRALIVGQLRQGAAASAPAAGSLAAARTAAAAATLRRKPELFVEPSQRIGALGRWRHRLLHVRAQRHDLNHAAVLLQRFELLIVHVARVVAQGANR